LPASGLVWYWKYPVHLNKTPAETPTLFPLLMDDRQAGTSRPVIWCDPGVLNSLTPAQRETMDRLISQFNSMSIEERQALAKTGASLALSVALAHDGPPPDPESASEADDDPYDLGVNPLDPHRLNLALPAW
jgi:hypothetical protein